MKNKRRQFGFSLIEVLMAVGVLTVGLLMVAGTFPVGIHLTAVSTERTLGAVASDEAFAKIRLYGSDSANRTAFLGVLSNTQCEDFNDVMLSATYPVAAGEFLYPSDSTANQVYSWSAICRKNSGMANDTSVQITVFVSRKVAQGLNYYSQGVGYVPQPSPASDWPLPVIINKSGSQYNNFITVGTDIKYFADDSVIVDDATGKMYRVIELDQTTGFIYLDRELEDNISYIWVVPVPIDGGKNPCVGVYQRIINF